MPFPNSDRVIYRKNPLAEVICQFRFPPILRIDSEKPVAFQEEIRRAYPLYSEESAEITFAPPELINQLPANIRSSLVRVIGGIYKFASEDNTWSVNLTREFLALTTYHYERWEIFRAHLEKPLVSLESIYQPVFYSRIGLRYRNIIQRSKLGLADVPWSELLQPYIAAELNSTISENIIKEAQHTVVVNLEDNQGQVRINHGIVIPGNDDEICYLLDFDFFIEEKVGLTDGRDILDRFNQKTRQLFRWCITDKLHESMEPDPID